MKSRKFYPWLVVALLWVVALLNYMDRQMLSTMQAAMKVDIVELQQAEAFGALMAVFLWIYGIVSPFAGIVADRVSRKKLVESQSKEISSRKSLCLVSGDLSDGIYLQF